MLSSVKAAALYRPRTALHVLAAVAKLKTSPTTAEADDMISMFFVSFEEREKEEEREGCVISGQGCAGRSCRRNSKCLCYCA